MHLSLFFSSKYAWTIPIRIKEAIIVRNAFNHAFISADSEKLRTDNRMKLINSKFKLYIEGIDVDHIFGTS